jgi:hypothetical protein
LLSEPVEDADEMPRSFKQTKDGAFCLGIAMRFQVLARTRVVTYVFKMEPFSAERIDVLESRMRDLQEEMRALRVEGTGSRAVVELQETVKKLQGEMVCRQAESWSLQCKIKDIESIPLTIHATATGKTSGNSLCWPATGNYSNGRDPEFAAGHVPGERGC